MILISNNCSSILPHQDLYRQIVAQTREVRACIRTAEEHTSHIVPDTAAAVASASSPPRKCNDGGNSGSLKGLETRYHMLYLQAIEVQCLLEGLLERKELSVSSRLYRIKIPTVTSLKP